MDRRPGWEDTFANHRLRNLDTAIAKMSVAFWSIRIGQAESKQVEIPEGYVLNLVNVRMLYIWSRRAGDE